MSRNRMKDSQSLHWMGVVKWILIAGLLSGLGLSYMLCKNQTLALAEETSRMQKKLAAIEARNKELACDLDTMKSPAFLQRRLAEMNSDLVQWNDPRASWVRLDQNTRAKVDKFGTMPRSAPNFDSSVMAADATVPGTVH
jgi:hypothetical protein